MTDEKQQAVEEDDFDLPKTDWVKTGVDYGPLIAFGIAYFVLKNTLHSPDKEAPFLYATGVLVVASIIAIACGFWLSRKIPWVPVITATFAVVFGGLTLIFHDPTILKIKVSIVLGLNAAWLLGGLALGKPPLKYLMGETLPLSCKGWQQITLFYGLFCLAMALTNEVIWRTQTESVWVGWKLALTPIFLVFSLALSPIMMKHMEPKAKAKPVTGSEPH